ncbi:MAG: GTPase [Magnetococcales bacterium]|nr:GTPase [Magnetococcales bacterium]
MTHHNTKGSSTDGAPEHKEEPKTKLQQANATLKNYIKGSGAVALLPFPYVDMVLLTGVQLKMLQSLAKIYHIKFTKDIGKSTLSSLLGGVLPSTVGMGVASSLKFVPALGTAVGIASTSVIAIATTYAVGKVFIQHFESGGTFLNFDPEKVKEYFAQEFEDGKQMAFASKHEAA